MLALCLLALATLPLARSAPRPVPAQLFGRAAGALSGEGPLRAGAARVRIQLAPDAVIGGYAGRHRAHGEEVPLYARALAFSEPGVTAVIASVDAMLVPGSLEAAVAAPPCLLLAATHTHTGAGGTWDALFPSWAGNGAFDKAQRDAVAEATSEAIRQALAAQKPAQLLVAREEWQGGPARVRSAGPLDPQLSVLRFTGVGTLVVYGMHPTSAPRGKLSADWPGRAAELLERDGLPALVLQGAGGNATYSGEDPGALVAAEAQRLLAQAAPAQTPRVSCSTALLALPPPQASPRTPWLSRRAVANVIGSADDGFVEETRITLGELQLQGVPGEPVGELGLRARPRVLIGLADGYAGYVETAERWSEGAGESSKTYYGPSLAQALGL